MRLTISTANEVDSLVELVNDAYRGAASGGWTTEAGLIEGPFPYDDPSVGVPLRDDLTLITLRKVLRSPLSSATSSG